MQEKYLNKSVIIQWKIKRKNINKKKKILIILDAKYLVTLSKIITQEPKIIEKSLKDKKFYK